MRGDPSTAGFLPAHHHNSALSHWYTPALPAAAALERRPLAASARPFNCWRGFTTSYPDLERTWGVLVLRFDAAECEEISLGDGGVMLVQGLKQALLEEEGGVGRAIGASLV
jgi:hypothetical protein